MSRLFLRLGAALALALLAFTAYRRLDTMLAEGPAREYVLFYVLPLAGVAALLWLLSLAGRDTRISALVTLAAAGIAVYGAEIYLRLQGYDVYARVEDAARRGGETFDHRTIDEVVADTRKTDPTAHPFMRALNQGGAIMPLANTPSRTIVWCNERGRYLVFRSDRHGFNNPDAIWDSSGVEIAVVGDSFVQGACAPDNDGMAGRARAANPSIVNLGIGGNEPLTNLATLREYAPVLRPRRIVWVHYAGNDLSGMSLAANHPVLRRYVEEPDFRQNLPARADEIAALMDGFFAAGFGSLNRYERSPLEQMLRNPTLALRFTALRERLGMTHNDGTSVDFGLFERTMRRAKELADSLGAELSFVSLPHALQAERPLDEPEQRVKAIVEALGIFHLDAGAVMRARGAPERFYVFGRYGGHLSAAGDALFGELILAAAARRAPR
jgi:hypothetical protein